MALTPRRALLAGAGSTVAASLLLAGSDAPHETVDPGTLASIGDELGINIVTDPRWANGAVGDDATDSTAAVQAAIDEAAQSRNTVYFPPGVYRVGALTVPSRVHLQGFSPSFSRFGYAESGHDKASVVLRRIRESGAGSPLIDSVGAGSGISCLGLDGDGGSDTVLRFGVFESTLHSVMIFNNAGIGLDVPGANNTRWSEIYVNSCGTDTLPAVRIWGKVDAEWPFGGGNQTNNFYIANLHIEGSRQVALDVGWDSDPTSVANNKVEWLHISHLHIEGATDREPLVRIGVVRSVVLSTPMLFNEGTAAVLAHRQPVALNYGAGGVRIIGGTVLGAGRKDTPHLVQLVAGDDFAALGTRFLRFTDAAVHIGAQYGARMSLDASCTFEGQAMSDARATPSPLATQGDLLLTGRLHSVPGSEPPTAGAAVGSGPGTPAPSISGTDTAHLLAFGTGSVIPDQPLVSVNFSRPPAAESTIQLTARTKAAAAGAAWVQPTPQGYQVFLANPPAGPTPAATYAYSVLVTGIGDPATSQL